MVPSEVPGFFLAIIVSSQLPPLVTGEMTGTVDQLALVLNFLICLGLVFIAVRAWRTRAAADVGLQLDRWLGSRSGRQPFPSQPCQQRRRRLTWQLVLPWPRRPRTVERMRDLSYGPHGRSNRLDLYRHRSRPGPSPTLIHLHGGHFRWGRKSREARSLLHRLASKGWTCLSADYRLAATPGESFPNCLIDAKRVVAWARTEGTELGVDPGMIVMAGSSAGAHLTCMCALTPNDARFQPGFEDVDTSLAGGIGLYGYYGRLGGPLDEWSSPFDHLSPDSPPLLLLHGTNDTYTPLEGARALAEQLDRTSDRPVILTELRGAQHNFDLFTSIRFEAVIDAVEHFTTWIRHSARAGQG